MRIVWGLTAVLTALCLAGCETNSPMADADAPVSEASMAAPPEPAPAGDPNAKPEQADQSDPQAAAAPQLAPGQQMPAQGAAPQSGQPIPGQPAPAQPAAQPPAQPTAPAEAPPPADEGTSEKADVGVGAKGRDYGGPGFVTTPIETLFKAQDMITFQVQIPNAMKLYKAAHDNKGPSSQDEFMQVIVKEHGVELPPLPPGDVYWYDVKQEELLVRHPKPQ